MLLCMKTTIELSEKLLKEAKKYAAEKGLTLKSVIETALRNMFEHKNRPIKFSLRKATFKGEGVQEGQSEGDWTSVRGKIYKGRGE